MNENVFDVLMYLFENYFYENAEPNPDRETLENELSEVGFTSPEVNKAFKWLDDLADPQRRPALTTADVPSVRVFNEPECRKLDLECRGFLLFLEQAGILTPSSRELVIDRLMALDGDDIDLDALKWVVLMILFSQPGDEEAYAWMETLIFENSAQQLH